MYHATMSVADQLRKTADLGYEYVELSPRADWFFWHRYLVNPPGVDARVHQHNEIGNGEVNWEEFFSTLRDGNFDGVATVCVFGWEEEADAIHRRMLERVK